MMNRKFREFVQLIRLWNMPTAPADSFCGFFIAASADISAWRIAGVMLVSALIYSAGMAWNDIFDIERDRNIHPDRPLPSGRLAKKAAGRFALILMLAGIFIGAALGLGVALLVLLLVVLTFTYNVWSKHSGIMGCLNMGACRFVNMWIGIAAAGGLLSQTLPYPATLAAYITAVTLVSLQEESALTRRGFLLTSAMPVITLLPVAVFAVLRAGEVEYSLLALVPLLLLALWISATAVSAAGAAQPNLGAVVRVAVSGVILLDAAMLFTAGKPIYAMACAVLLIPTLAFVKIFTRKRFRTA